MKTLIFNKEPSGSKKLSAVCLGLLSFLNTAVAADLPTAVGKGEGQLNIVAWPGYIERGESDKNYDWVTQFEKQTSCKVNVKTAATSDEMVSLMAKGVMIWSLPREMPHCG